MPPAVRMCPSPARISVDAPISSPGVTPSMISGIPGLADRRNPAVADADVRLVDAGRCRSRPPMVMTRSGAPAARVAVGDCPMPSRITLPPPNFDFVAVGREVALDANDQVGVGEADAIAGRRPVVVGVGAAR